MFKRENLFKIEIENVRKALWAENFRMEYPDIPSNN